MNTDIIITSVANQSENTKYQRPADVALLLDLSRQNRAVAHAFAAASSTTESEFIAESYV